MSFLYNRYLRMAVLIFTLLSLNQASGVYLLNKNMKKITSLVAPEDLMVKEAREVPVVEVLVRGSLHSPLLSNRSVTYVL